MGGATGRRSGNDTGPDPLAKPAVGGGTGGTAWELDGVRATVPLGAAVGTGGIDGTDDETARSPGVAGSAAPEWPTPNVSGAGVADMLSSDAAPDISPPSSGGERAPSAGAGSGDWLAFASIAAASAAILCSSSLRSWRSLSQRLKAGFQALKAPP